MITESSCRKYDTLPEQMGLICRRRSLSPLRFFLLPAILLIVYFFAVTCEFVCRRMPFIRFAPSHRYSSHIIIIEKALRNAVSIQIILVFIRKDKCCSSRRDSCSFFQRLSGTIINNAVPDFTTVATVVFFHLLLLLLLLLFVVVVVVAAVAGIAIIVVFSLCLQLQGDLGGPSERVLADELIPYPRGESNVSSGGIIMPRYSRGNREPKIFVHERSCVAIENVRVKIHEESRLEELLKYVSLPCSGQQLLSHHYHQRHTQILQDIDVVEDVVPKTKNLVNAYFPGEKQPDPSHQIQLRNNVFPL
mmetsp:Transcript_29865/g.50599  ORF Transcript_29865/g.50599 Transcript_29865/m.50599 type:complete len:305 (-) Transcript_29865:1544-2458(-)